MRVRLSDGYALDVADEDARELIRRGHATAVEQPGGTAAIPRRPEVERAALDIGRVERAVALPR
jgi:hypothetical protein